MELEGSTAQGNRAEQRGRDLPIDHDHLDRYTLGDRALELEILTLFVAQAPETLVCMEPIGDAKTWRDAAHTLKGSARAVGASRVAAAAAAAELLAAAPADSRRAAIAALTEAVDEARRYIASLAVEPRPANAPARRSYSRMRTPA